MKRILLAVLLSFAIALPAFAMTAGDAKTRLQTVYPHKTVTIDIPETGAYIVYNEQNGIEYYRWTLKDKEEFCDDLGLSDGLVPATKDITNTEHGNSHVFTAPAGTTSVVGEYRDWIKIGKNWVWSNWTSATLVAAGELNHWKFNGGNHDDYQKVIASYMAQNNACTDAYANCRGLTSGQGTDLPSYLNAFKVSCDGGDDFDRAMCMNVESDTMFFTDDVSVAYGTPNTTVEMEQLVVRAYVGDTIDIDGMGFTWVEKKVSSHFIVRYFAPAATTFTVIMNTPWVDEVVTGQFINTIKGFTFDKAGTYAFRFNVIKQSGTKVILVARVIVTDAPAN